MKTILTIIMLLSAFAIKSQSINIEHERIVINGVGFDSTKLIEDYIRVLGRPSRVKKLANNIYIFDSLGIYIYENYKGSNKIIELNFDFVKNREFDFSPAKAFSGKICLAEYSYKLSRHTSYKSLKKLCKANKDTSLQEEYGNSDFNYGNFNLLFEHGHLGINTKKFTIDFRVRKYKYIQ